MGYKHTNTWRKPIKHGSERTQSVNKWLVNKRKSEYSISRYRS